jgi:hypothetical protein
MNNVGRGFGGRSAVYYEVAALASKHGIKTAVETGTYKGWTTVALAEVFSEVYSVEVNREYHLESAEKLSKWKRIMCYHGNSADWLRRLLPNLRQPVFFYLDAHWYEDWPILGEIGAVSEASHSGAVIVIDDFKVPGRADFGYDTYGGQELNWDYVKEAVSSIYGKKGFRYYYNDSLAGSTGNGVLFVEPISGEGPYSRLGSGVRPHCSGTGWALCESIDPQQPQQPSRAAD